MMKTKNGFTLIELSIVIVIIGLIIAAIIGSKTVINAARLNNVISEAEQFKSSFSAFKLKYDAYPGDIDNAYSYWGNSCDSTPANCNGDGNNKINEFTSGGVNEKENIRAWQHLYLAEFIKESLDGKCVAGENDCYLFAGINTPTSRFPNATWNLNSGNLENRFVKDLDIYVELNENGSSHGRGPVLTPKQAYSIDSKIDDGTSRGGQVAGIEGLGYGTVTTYCESAPNYLYSVHLNLTSCRLAFPIK